MIKFTFAHGHIRQLAGMVVVIAILIGTIDFCISKQPWYFIYLQAFVITTCSTFFCSMLICSLIKRILNMPKVVYYSILITLALIGSALGAMSGSLILEQRLIPRPIVLIITLLVGLAASLMITAYMIIRDKLQIKISRLKEIELENERLKRYESEARLSSLQAKLNPHFLFNTLNAAAALVYDDPNRAEQSIVLLSELYRRVLSISKQTYIVLREEIELIEDYLKLEHLRFEDKINYSIRCPDELLPVRIPGLLIEPLVENVIKHNQSEIEKRLDIEIRFQKENENLTVSVSDNGTGFDSNAQTGFGLTSIQERLRILYGNAATLSINSSPGNGTTVEVMIPLQENKEVA